MIKFFLYKLHAKSLLRGTIDFIATGNSIK